MVQKVDVLVIGAGPGGYPAAIRAAQLGKKVIVVDKGTIGGECLNWGCIPSKALISAANMYHKVKSNSASMGINVKGVTLDVSTLQSWKSNVQTKLINGIEQLLKGNKVKTIIGAASFISKNTVEILTEDGKKEQIEAQNIIIATGATFISLPGIEIDEDSIVSAKGALSFEKIPESLLVIGGGVIGIELGTVYAKFGSNVTIVELLPDILPGTDPRMTSLIKKRLESLKSKIYTNSSVKSVVKQKSGLKVEIDTKDGRITTNVEKILLSVGKKATTLNLGLEKIGIETDERGFIKVNNKQQTNKPHIYAIGDCTGVPFTAHKATKQGIVAAEVIAGLPSETDFKSINVGAFFTDPEIAFVGLDEKEAKKAGYAVKVGTARFNTSGRALTQLSTDGYVRVVIDANSEIVLGVQIIGPEASDLISEAALGIEMGATAEDLGWTVHPHPTLPEMIMEAAEAALGKAIHQVNLISKK